MDIRFFRPFIGLVWLAFFGVSCTSANKFYKHFTRTPGSIQYLHDTPGNQKIPDCHVHVVKPVVTDPLFTRPGLLQITRSYVIPLLVYNEWGRELDYKLGCVSIQQDISAFAQSALITESM